MTKRVIRPIRIEGNVAYVPLTWDMEAIIDAADVGLISGRNWHTRKSKVTFYARGNMCRPGKWRLIFMHRLIMNAPDDLMIDHINGNGLDNRRCNLRFADKYQNAANRRPNKNKGDVPKGVSLEAASGRWKAGIEVRGKSIFLGRFSSPEAAGAAYREASARYFGEFACAS